MKAYFPILAIFFAIFFMVGLFVFPNVAEAQGLRDMGVDYSASIISSGGEGAGAISLVSFLIFCCLCCLPSIGLTALVYFLILNDAKKQGVNSPGVWALLSALFWPVLLVYLIVVRNQPGNKQSV